MGGEKHNVFTLGSLVQGSPPHGRGKGNRHSVPSGFTGITPAWAGKRLTRPAMTGTPRDHPRVGGEKHPEVVTTGMSLGSPPRGRGKDIPCFVHHALLRITPAWAGKSPVVPATRSASRDHPRVDGEKLMLLIFPMRRIGSPPRGRGKEVIAGTNLPMLGITPAWAGKRLPLPDIAAQTQDHPRVGGEKFGGTWERIEGRGSPPRGRGKAGFRLMQANGFGITPAWAGKSSVRIVWVGA